MKALRLVFFASVCILINGAINAQVKIGDNPLEIANERLLEIERAGQLLIVTDSLELGLTDNQNLNVTSDALMLKLFGYGLEQFTPLLTGKTQNFFLASNSDGQVMQIPLVLDLIIADSSVADLSLFNGVDTFGTINLMQLDSIFATDIQLRDSTALLRTLISNSEASDGDTITGNEWLASVITSGTELVFTENVSGIDTQHVTRVDLDPVWATDTQLADTTIVLRDLIDSLSLYTRDGTLEEDRTVTGASNDLVFTGVDTFSIIGTATNVTTTGTIDLDAAINLNASGDGNTTITADAENNGAGDLVLATGSTNVVTIQPDEDVLFRSASVDSTLYIDAAGNITAGIYGTGTTTGTFANIIGVTADGELIDVTVADILATDADSSIYTHDGTLLEDRTLTGGSKDLTFTGVDTFAVSGVGTTITSTGTNTLTSTGQTTINSADLDINGAAITVDGSSITETSTGAIDIDAATDLTASGDGNTTITADEDDSGAGDLVLATGSTGIVTIQPDEDVLFRSASVDSTLYIDAAGNITAGIYGTGTTTGTFANIIGVTADGELIDVTVADILATDADSSIYTHDGTLLEDRTLTGGSKDLTFTGVDTFAVSGVGTTITSTGTNTLTSTGQTTINSADLDINGAAITVDGSSITETSTGAIDIDAATDLTASGDGNTTITADEDDSGAGDLVLATGSTGIVTIQPDEDVLFRSASVDSTLYIDAAGNITAGIYGTGTTTGTFANIIGVTADGELIDVTVADILATDADSSIYTHDGTLLEDRTLTGGSKDLTFTGVDTFAVSGVGTTITSTGTNTLTSTGQTTINSADLDINGAAITVDGSSITETSTGAIDIDAATDLTASGDGNTTITADEDDSGAGDLVLATGSTGIVTIQPDEDVLFRSASVDSTLYIDAAGNITAGIYGTGTTTGTFANIIGVTADGELIDVTVADILATDADSSIYSHDGTLLEDRTLTGGSKDLTFTGVDTFAVSGVGTTITSTGTNTLTSTGQTTINSADLDINGAAITVDGSSITETSTGAIDIDAATDLTASGDGNTTITADEDDSGAGDLVLATGSTGIVTIQPDEDVLFRSASVDSTLYIDAAGNITAGIYGTGTTTGTFANIIGVTADGELIDVTVADILATDADSSIYTHDGTLLEDRTLTGGSKDLTFTGVDTFAVSGVGTTITSTGTNTLTSTGQTTINSADLDINGAAITVDGSSITETSTGAIDIDAATDLTASGDGNTTITADEDDSGAGDLVLATGSTGIVTIQPDEDVLFRSASVDSTLYIDAAGNITAGIYGTGTTTGTFANIIGVTADGELIDVTVADILATDADSSIYTHDGTLLEDRTLTGGSKDLTFTGVDTFAVSGVGTTITSTGTNTLTSTGQTTINSADLDINGAAITVDGSSITETSTGAIDIDAATDLTASGDGNTTITADEDDSGAGDLVLATGSTGIVTIQPDEDVLFRSASVDSTLYIDAAGNITAGIYGTGTTTGTFANIIGVTADGELIDVTVADILATDADSSIYSHDGTLLEDRTLTGGSKDLTFTGVDTFAVSGVGTTITSTGTNTLTSTGQTTINSADLDINGAAITVDGSSITETSTGAIDIDAATDLTASGDGNTTITADEDDSGAGDLVLATGSTGIVTIQPDEDVLFRSASVDSTLYIDAAGNITAGIYGTGTTTGTFANIIGVTADGELIDVTVADILATDADSSIYTHDGTLLEDRTLTGGSKDLTFTGVDTFAVSGVGTTITSTGTNTLTSTGQTTINSADLDINGAAITVDGSSITETSTGAIDIDAATDLTASGDGNTTITADEDDSGAGDLVLATGSTGIVTIQPDEDVLFRSASVDSTLYIDAAGNITAGIYGTGTTTGTFANIIGVTADGELIDVTVADILATDEDSTIYTHNGTLTEERTMWMDSKNLFFVSGTSGSGNTDTITITPDGRMAIGRSYVTTGIDTSANGIRLDVNGDIYAVQVHSSSDERFKKNIKQVDSALDKVMRINGVTYDFRIEEFPNRQFPNTKQLGFVAQNVNKVIPEVVKTNSDGYMSIDYSKITALLNEAIKEQQTQIDEHQSKIAILEQKLEASLENNSVLINEIASIKSLLKELVKAEVAED